MSKKNPAIPHPAATIPKNIENGVVPQRDDTVHSNAYNWVEMQKCWVILTLAVNHM